MSARRKRTTDEFMTGTTFKKRRTTQNNNNQERTLEQLRLCQEFLEGLKLIKTEDGRLLCESFLKNPSKRSDPDYYKVVKEPMDIARLQQKLRMEEYAKVEEFYADFQLMIDNCAQYFEPSSTEYGDAMRLQQVLEEKKGLWEAREAGLMANGELKKEARDTLSPHPSDLSSYRSVSPSGSAATAASSDTLDVAQVEDILCTILELTDDSKRLISPPFRLLQSPEEFPSYYVKIKTPIDLRTIAEKTRAGCYTHMKLLEADFKLLCNNAKVFNKPSSLIHKDANIILKAFLKKKNEVVGRNISHKRMEHARQAVDSLLAQSSVDENDDYSEDSEEDEEMESSDDPIGQLYWTVRNAPTSMNDHETMLSDPFLELPSKHYYPDYFDEIAQPMSFFMINSKLKKGDYKELEQLVDDLMLVFANACEYNVEGSEIYKAAKKLREITVTKAWQLKPEMDLEKYLKPGSSHTSPKAGSEKMKPSRGARRLKEEDSWEEEKDGFTLVADATPSAPTVAHLTPEPALTSPKKKWRRNRPLSTGITPLPPPTGKPGRKSMDELMLRFRVKLMMFWDIVNDYRENGTYWPARAFLKLPSRAEYPSYYEFIENPIDLTFIKKKIENNGYTSSNELMADFATLFENARRYNEPNSNIYRDAETLQELVSNTHDSMKSMPFEAPQWIKEKLSSPAILPRTPPITPVLTVHATTPRTEKKSTKEKGGIHTEEQKKMTAFVAFLRECRDDKNRKIANCFLKLPSKQEYPNYYEVIKKPIDLHKIQLKINSQNYSSNWELMSDLHLMIDNACTYNEPDSQLYKDAIQLQRILLEKKKELLGANAEKLFSVQAEIRTLFTNIIVGVFNEKDADGRCYSDGLIDVLELLKGRGVADVDMPFSLDEIKRNIDRNRYRRLDRLQRDVFYLLEMTRIYSRTDSQMWEDACAVQLAFIRVRDETCKDIIISTAFLTTIRDVQEDLEIKKRRKASEEAENDKKEEKEQKEEKCEGEVDLESLEVEGVTYKPGGFALVAPSESGVPDTHVIRIERIFRDDKGVIFVRGRWFYRPHETFHLVTKKFMENEVFITNYVDSVTSERLTGRCFVCFYRSWLRYKPKGFEEAQLLVCEERYLGKSLHFKKIKHWPYEKEEEELEWEERPEPVQPQRKTVQILRKNGERECLQDAEGGSKKSEDEEEETEECLTILDMEREEVREGSSNASHEDDGDGDGRKYFTQIVTNYGRYYTVGNCVLVFNPRKPQCDVMRINRLWREKDGREYFSGGWFARPVDIVHDEGQTFFKREVLAVVQSDQTRSLDDIQSKCAVLQTKQYIKERPTEIPECDVFVCDKRVDGHCQSTLPTAHDSAPEDPDYFSAEPVMPAERIHEQYSDSSLFNKLVAIDPARPVLHIDAAKSCSKLKTYCLPSQIPHEEFFIFKTPLTMEKEMSPLIRKSDEIEIMEVCENPEGGNNEAVGTKELVSWLAHQPKLTAKSKSGYILFSAEIRKRIMHENPEAGFGEVSKIVGVEWKKLSEDQKKQYEVRAEYIANERAKQDAADIATKRNIQPGQVRVFMCKWHNCDYQFDSSEGLCEHLIHYHTSQIIVDSDNQYVCCWVTCMRNRKDGKPFPSLPRLHRHIKEKHLASSFRVIYGNQRAKNFFKYIVSAAENGTPAMGHLVHFPYGMHPSQVAAAVAGGSAVAAAIATAPAGQPNLNGHSHLGGGGNRAGPSSGAGSASMQHNGHNEPSTSAQRLNGYATTSVQASPSHYVQTVPGPSSSGIHVSSSSGSPATHQIQQHHHPSHHGMAGPAHHATPIADPRAIVTLTRPLEPVFVAPPNSIHSRRVLHSEAYLRYIESLGNSKQKTVSTYEKSLRANQRNSQQNAARPIPSSWLKESRGRKAVKEEDVTKALWRLREELLQSTVGIAREYEGPL